MRTRFTANGSTTGTGGHHTSDVTDNFPKVHAEKVSYSTLILTLGRLAATAVLSGRPTTTLSTTSVTSRSRRGRVQLDSTSLTTPPRGQQSAVASKILSTTQFRVLVLSCIPEGRAPTVSWWLRGLAMCWVVTAVPTLSNISGPWTKSVTHTTKGGHAKKMNSSGDIQPKTIDLPALFGVGQEHQTGTDDKGSSTQPKSVILQKNPFISIHTS